MTAIVCRVNIIPADALAANADRASAGMILTREPRIFLLLYKGKKFNNDAATFCAVFIRRFSILVWLLVGN